MKARTYSWNFIQLHTYMSIHVHRNEHIYTHTYKEIFFIKILMYTYINAHTHAYIFNYYHSYIYTYIHLWIVTLCIRFDQIFPERSKARQRGVYLQQWLQLRGAVERRKYSFRIGGLINICQPPKPVTYNTFGN